MKNDSRAESTGWERIWQAQDGTYKGRCQKCGFVHVFIEGHDAQFQYCPQCGDYKGVS